jgi:hypothetical protein
MKPRGHFRNPARGAPRRIQARGSGRAARRADAMFIGFLPRFRNVVAANDPQA